MSKEHSYIRRRHMDPTNRRIRKIDRDELLQVLVKNYLEI